MPWPSYGRIKLASPAARYTSIAFSPDGKRLAAASSKSETYLWDLEKGAPAKTLKGKARSSRQIAFSADGKRMAVGGGCGAIDIWKMDP